MEFAGSSYAVPIVICVVAGALVAYELWRRRGNAGRGADAGRGAGAGRGSDDRVAADEIVDWHRLHEHTIFAWLAATDEVLATADEMPATTDEMPAPADVAPESEQALAQALVQFQSVSRHFQKAADKHPSETERAELLEMHDCAQEMAAALEEKVSATETDEPSSQSRARYETLRNRWVGHLRQMTTDDTFAMQLLDAKAAIG